MQDLSLIASRIKDMAKLKNVSLKTAMSDLEMNVNTVSLIAKGREISFVNFARIAEYFDVSVDYLIGRTNVREVNMGSIYSVSDSPQSAVGNNNSVVVGAPEPTAQSDMISEMIARFNELSFEDKIDIMHQINEKGKSK